LFKHSITRAGLCCFVKFDEKPWNEERAKGIDSDGQSMKVGYSHNKSDQDFDVLATYGQNTVSELKELKKEYDVNNVCSRVYPKLVLENQNLIMS
jgi:hypothetical protein